MMMHKLNPKMKMLLMNHLNSNQNYRDLNMLQEVYSMMYPMLEEIDQRKVSSDHECHLLHHQIDLLREDLYHDMDVEHQVEMRNRRGHHRQRSF